MGSRKIFIIDDDATARAVLRASLNASGYATLEAESGRGVLRSIQEHAPDLIVTDIIMDDQEGLATIMQIREEYEALPIIAVSSNQYYLKFALDLGADTTLIKPIDVPLLLTKVAELI